MGEYGTCHWECRREAGKGGCLCFCPVPFVLFAEAGRALEAVGICGGAAACPGAVNSTLRSISRGNTLDLRHWGAKAI